MLTPQFKLSQCEQFINIEIKTPACANISDCDTYVNENDFIFYCKPYYLRLVLPGKILDGNQLDAYSFENNTFRFRYPKAKPGEHFANLEITNILLQPPQKLNNGGKIEEVEPDEYWYLEQKYPENTEFSGQYYGFALAYNGLLKEEEQKMLIALPDPDETPAEERRLLRLKSEVFDEDYYLADLYDVPGFIDFEKPFPHPPDIDATLLNLVSRKRRVIIQDERSVYLTMVDILFSYCYNQRITDGDDNCESARNICDLSPSLSFLDQQWDSSEELIHALVRRSLCVPLFRNWKFSLMVLADTEQTLKNGKTCILKCFLHMNKIMQDAEMNLINELFINDYVVWVNDHHNLDNVIANNGITFTADKEDFPDLELQILELAARIALNGIDGSSVHDDN